MLTREPVTKNQLKEIARIETLGFVKIVLFYELTAQGASQLKECLVDGLKVPVALG